MAIADLRRDYNASSLNREDLNADPIAQFDLWFNTALAARTPGNFFRRVGVSTYKWFQSVCGKTSSEANAMTLATADREGHPSARIVLLKGVDARGFIFFTQYEGNKGRELTENPHAALVFYWPELERQVCVGGGVVKLPAAESDAYFQSRPRGSRLAAWVERQSTPVPDREFLEARYRKLHEQYPDAVPRPEYWGGYILAPTRIEFWQGRPSRLHDRFRYTKQPDGSWQVQRLAP